MPLDLHFKVFFCAVVPRGFHIKVYGEKTIFQLFFCGFMDLFIPFQPNSILDSELRLQVWIDLCLGLSLTQPVQFKVVAFDSHALSV